MVDETRLFSRPLAVGISVVGLLIVAVLLIQLRGGVISVDYYTPVLVFAFISNLIIMPSLLFMATRFRPFKLPAVTWTHISMSLMIIYFSQAYSPFTAAWSILMLVASTYYGWRGFIWSGVVLAITAAAYIILFPQNLADYGGTITYSILSVLVVALTIFTSFLFVRVIMRSNRKNHELQVAQAEQKLRANQLAALLNSIGEPVVAVDGSGHVTLQNSASQAFFDTNQSLIGKEIDRLLDLRDRGNRPVSVAKLSNDTETRSLRDDLVMGSEEDPRFISLRFSRIEQAYDAPQSEGVVILIRDITKQKSLEDERDEFISVTSHELRTPLAIIEGSISNIELLKQKGVTDDRMDAALDSAHEQVVQLSRIVNDLSTLSRAEHGDEYRSEEFDLTQVYHELMQEYQKEASKKSLQLDLDIEPGIHIVETNRLYVQEILKNLLTNGIKYTKSGNVTLWAKKADFGDVQCGVTDTGIGISESEIGRVFDKFYRSEDYRTRETGGTGLGLYVAKRLADKIGMVISVQSRLNHGSTFSFTIPKKHDEKPRRAENSPKDSQ